MKGVLFGRLLAKRIKDRSGGCGAGYNLNILPHNFLKCMACNNSTFLARPWLKIRPNNIIASLMTQLGKVKGTFNKVPAGHTLTKINNDYEGI